jgi:hypothetical protein
MAVINRFLEKDSSQFITVIEFYRRELDRAFDGYIINCRIMIFGWIMGVGAVGGFRGPDELGPMQQKGAFGDLDEEVEMRLWLGEVLQSPYTGGDPGTINRALHHLEGMSAAVQAKFRPILENIRNALQSGKVSDQVMAAVQDHIEWAAHRSEGAGSQLMGLRQLEQTAHNYSHLPFTATQRAEINRQVMAHIDRLGPVVRDGIIAQVKALQNYDFGFDVDETLASFGSLVTALKPADQEAIQKSLVAALNVVQERIFNGAKGYMDDIFSGAGGRDSWPTEMKIESLNGFLLPDGDLMPTPRQCSPAQRAELSAYAQTLIDKLKLQ